MADYSNHRIQVFDVNGNYHHQFGSRESGNGQLNYPTGITTHNNQVFVTEQINRRISVFHTNGQFSHIIGERQLGEPRDVTVNTNNQLLVADFNYHCIYTFTLDGNYVSKFATQGSAGGQLSSPYSLTTDLYGFIDKFIHYFGSVGSDDGKFNGPRGIALSPNGNIYVTDYYNKRVQIFSTY